jgi:class 3 adenylate cyclase
LGVKSKSDDRQTGLERENAELRRQLAESLAQQQALGEVLGVINASPGELTAVFDAVLDKAMDLCEANFGYLLTYDGEGFQAAADRGHPAFAAWVRGQGRIIPDAGTTNGRIAAGERVVHIADATNDPDYRGDNAVRRAVIEIGGFRTLLTVALRQDEALLGVIHIYRQEVRPFTDKQVALVENFAAQAVIAMENARLITETREALEQQTATAEVLQVINSSPGDLSPVFDALLEKALRLCEASYGHVMTFDGEYFETVAVRGKPELVKKLHQLGPIKAMPESLGGRLALGEPVVNVSDTADDDAYRSGSETRKAVVEAGMRSLLGVGLRKDDSLLGIIIVYREEKRPFSQKETGLLQNFGAQAVIAMENARLLGELRQRTGEVAELNRGLEARVADQVEELGRVGRLKRFLAPQLAELIVSQGDEKILESHRREIVVVFCDLRGYTAFTETAEPEEVLDFLREYHGALGPLVAEYEGTLDQFSGDGIMVFFNDPVPIPDPAARAVKMAMAMRETATALTAVWRRRGRELGFGAGIAQGYATLGQIGFSERSGYTAIGTVCNVAARLCAEAKDGQILIAQRVAAGLDGDIPLEEIGPLPLKGITQPVVALNVGASGSAGSRLRLV